MSKLAVVAYSSTKGNQAGGDADIAAAKAIKATMLVHHRIRAAMSRCASRLSVKILYRKQKTAVLHIDYRMGKPHQ